MLLRDEFISLILAEYRLSQKADARYQPFVRGKIGSGIADRRYTTSR